MFPESNGVIKLSSPFEKPGRPGLQGHWLVQAPSVYSPPASGHRNGTTCRSIPGGTGRLTFLWLSCMRHIFKNRFSKDQVAPRPQEGESTDSLLDLLLAVGLRDFIWTPH